MAAEVVVVGAGPTGLLLAGDLAEAGTPLRALRLFDRVHLDLSTLPSEFAALLITPQYETERVLQQRADALGVRIVRGAEVTGVTQDGNGVDVATHGGAGTP